MSTIEYRHIAWLMLAAIVAAILTVCLMPFIVSPAHAAEALVAAAGNAGTTVDFSGVVSYLVETLAAAVLGLLLVGIQRGLKLLGLQNNKTLQATLENAAEAAVDWAKARAGVAWHEPISVDLHSQVLADAVSYLAARWPDYSKQAGLTGDALRDFVLRHLGPAGTAPSPILSAPAAS